MKLFENPSSMNRPRPRRRRRWWRQRPWWRRLRWWSCLLLKSYFCHPGLHHEWGGRPNPLHHHHPHRVLHPVAAWDQPSTKHLNRLRRNQLWLITCHHCVYVCVCRLMAAVNFHLNVSIHWKFLFSIEKFHIFPNRWTRVHHPHHLRLLKVNHDCWLRNNSSEAEAEENSFMARKI